MSFEKILYNIKTNSMTGVNFSLFQFMHFDEINLKITPNKKFCSLIQKKSSEEWAGKG